DSDRKPTRIEQRAAGESIERQNSHAEHAQDRQQNELRPRWRRLRFPVFDPPKLTRPCPGEAEENRQHHPQPESTWRFPPRSRKGLGEQPLNEVQRANRASD